MATAEASESENLLMPDLDDQEIKKEIINLLPSRTLGRGSHLSSFSDGTRATLNRRRSYPRTTFTSKKSSAENEYSQFFATLKQVQTLRRFGDTADAEGTIWELSDIRTLPIPIHKKKKFRHAALERPQAFKRSDRCAPKWSQKIKKDIDRVSNNFSSKFCIWSETIKEIEGKLGTGIVSYFIFLQWVFYVNLIIFILFLIFIVLPQSSFPEIRKQPKLYNPPPSNDLIDKFLNKEDSYNKKPTERQKFTDTTSLDKNSLSHLGELFDTYIDSDILDVSLRYSKENYTEAQRNNISTYCTAIYMKELKQRTSYKFLDVIQSFVQGTGWLEFTLLFTGFYKTKNILFFGLVYNMPLAFLFVVTVIFIICLCMMIQYFSFGIQETMMTRRGHSYQAYSNAVFCGWDYCIESSKVADIKHKSFTLEIKCTLAEDWRRYTLNLWSSAKKTKIYFLRVLANVVVVISLLGCYFLIYYVANYQMLEQQHHQLEELGMKTLFIQYLPPITITILNIVVPIFFNFLIRFEEYHSESAINISLFRTIFLRLTSIFVLISSFYQQITCEPKDMCGVGEDSSCSSPLCWETYVGQQMYKLVIMDFIVILGIFLLYDIPRDIIVRHFNNKCTKLIGRQVFDLPSQVLALVYSQTICWLGVFYSPLLPAVAVLKTVIVFYIKKVMVLNFCTASPIAYKASRSNAIFMIILMISYFLVMLIVGYSITSIEPSPGCGPFQNYLLMIDAIPDVLSHWIPTLNTVFHFLFSALFFVPACILLSLTAYYYWNVAVAQRQIAKALRSQIASEGRNKQFLLKRLVRVARRRIAS